VEVSRVRKVSEAFYVEEVILKYYKLKHVFYYKEELLMTKLEQLFNEYYSTENLTLDEQFEDMKAALSSLEIADEFYNFSAWLNKRLEEVE
jgi:hypothetical protein